MSTPRTALLVLSILVLVGVIELVRRRRLREEFSWLWAAAGSVGLLLAIAGPRVADALAVSWPTLVFAGALGFSLVISLDLCIRLSSAETRLKNLAQQAALLDKRLRDLSGKDRDEPEERA